MKTDTCELRFQVFRRVKFQIFLVKHSTHHPEVYVKTSAIFFFFIKYYSLDIILNYNIIACNFPRNVLGKTILPPLSVLVNPEPMYHYSQTSPVMSSMQQQQMLQIQCHSRPLLYRPSQQYTGQQPSVDGGYCSMTQDSLRESDIATADAQ